MSAHIVIIGGGFAGLACARRLAHHALNVTLIDRSNHHLFQPLLYQVASASLAAPSIATPLRPLFRQRQQMRVVMGEVARINREKRTVRLANGDTYGYDALVVASGAGSQAPEGSDASVLPLKSLDDAINIRNHLLAAFEMAEHETDAERRAALLTFAIVGGGPTGVELAGAVAEIARHTLSDEFHNIVPAQARIVLFDSSERLLSGFHPQSSRWARAALESLGVEIFNGVRVTTVDPHQLRVVGKDGTRHFHCAVTLWATGTQPSPLGQYLGADADGRVSVKADLSLGDSPEVFVIGDLARLPHACATNARRLPANAATASQMGHLAADNLLAHLAGAPTRQFRYRDLGQLAIIGRHHALAEIGDWRFYGATAWWFWLLVHIFYLIGFRNRIAVAIDWSWGYFTSKRHARILFKPPPIFRMYPPKQERTPHPLHIRRQHRH